MKQKLLLLLLALFSLTSASAYSFSAVNDDGKTIYYDTSGTNATVTCRSTNYNSYSGIVNIPETVTYNGTTYSVTSIGNAAFRSCSGLTSVTIPDSVTYIGDYAFYGCSGLTSIDIPDSVTSIGSSAAYGGYTFAGCSRLKEVNISDLSAWCAINFVATTSNPLCYAHYLYLNGELVEDLVIPSTVETINNYAFYGCSRLTSVTIGNSVTSIGYSAFKDCSGLKEVNISDLSAWCAINFGNTDSNPLYYAHNLYLNGELVEDLVIPSTVETINNYAFYGYSRLTSVTIPNSVTSIGNYAFKDCSGLISVTIGNSVTTIGSYAFSGCSGLTSVTVGNSVTTIGSEAFNECSGLKEVNISDLSAWCAINFVDTTSNPLLQAYNLYLNGELVEDLVIPSTVETINNYAFYGCSCLTSVTIGNSVTSIGRNAFYNLAILEDVYLSKNPTTISDDSFGGTTLAKIHISDEELNEGPGTFGYGNCMVHVPASVLQTYKDAWPDYATQIFAEGSGVYDVNIAAEAAESALANKIQELSGLEMTEALLNVTDLTVHGTINSYDVMVLHNKMLNLVTLDLSDASIVANSYEYYTGYHTEDDIVGARFLGDMGKVKSVKLPNSATSISSGAITSGSPKLTTIVIGEGTTSVAAKAFQNITTLCKVVIGNSVQTIGDYAFDGCTNLFEVTFGEGLKTIGNYAFQKSSLRSAVFGENLTKIGSYAFYQNASLKTIAFRNAVVSIGSYAFAECSILNITTLQVASIGDNAFNNCTSLHYLNVGAKSCGSESFSGCNSLKEVTFGKNVESIAAAAFAGTGLREVTLPEKLTILNLGVFYGCTSLASVTFPPNLITIASSTNRNSSYSYYKGVFEGCSSLQKIVLPKALETIGNYAFYGCSRLEEVRIPSSIVTIGDHSFSETVKDIFTYTIQPTKINQDTFESNLYTDAVLHVPATAFKLYFYNTQWSQFVHISDDAGVEYEYFYLVDEDLIIDEDTERLQGVPDEETGEVANDPNADLGEGSGLVVEGETNQNLGDVNLDSNGEDSGSIIGGGEGNGPDAGNIHAKNLKIRIQVKKNKWYFFCFPFDIELDLIEYPGQYVWRYYDGAARALNGNGGWKTLEERYLTRGKGYIFHGSQDGTLVLSVGEAHFHGRNEATTLELHSCENKADKNWNFIGNPFTSYYSIEDLGFDAPITYWDGTTYQAVRPGDDNYMLHPYQAFFVQKPENDEVGVEFEADKRVTKNQSLDEIFMQNLHNRFGKPKRAPRASDRKIVNLEVTDGTSTDATRIVFNEESSLEYELTNDATKFLTTTVPQIYTIGADNTFYAINERPEGDSVVKLGFYAPEEGCFTITATRADQDLELVDLKTGNSARLSSDYTFTAGKGTDNDRFILRVPSTDNVESITDADNMRISVEEAYGLDGKRFDADNARGIVIKRDNKGAKKVIVH